MKFYQVDAFTDKLFSGNPAGVCVLHDKWLPDEIMQNIAMESNLSETAFVHYPSKTIRWFTPVAEVPLCGHGTLAAAHVLFQHEQIAANEIVFQTCMGKGKIKVSNDDGMYTLDFPKDIIHAIPFTDDLDCFQFQPKEVWRGTEEYMLIFKEEEQVIQAVCNLEKATKIDLSGFIITAPAKEKAIDFVSRYFSPKFGINEDPVTGSAHTLLVPYWQHVMGQDTFNAYQASKRGGKLVCKAEGERIKISGSAVTFFVGEILITV